ncbi:cytochrome P450 [Marasmius fiardii PR-910]|nr:cytochrome P450 [Marasmius fiardii PR-910]
MTKPNSIPSGLFKAVRMTFPSPNMLTVILLSTVITTFLWTLFRRSPKNLPPGPPAEPIIGHIRIMPQELIGETWYEWSKTYGDVFLLKIFNRKTIVLNSMEAAHDLLEKRSQYYSCRPPFPVADTMGLGRQLGFLPYGAQFQKIRKAFQQYFSRQESFVYMPIQLEESRLLVRSLMEEPIERLVANLYKFTTTIITSAVYGHRITSEDDRFLKIGSALEQVIIHAGAVGSTPVDLFPWLRYLPSWFPGTYHHTYALRSRPKIQVVYDYPYQFVTEKMSKGEAPHSFLASQLQDLDSNSTEYEQDIEDIKSSSATAFLAGVDTSFSSLMTFLLCMVLNPEKQRKAQKEIDRVIGTDRLPEYSDRESLPYVENVLQEVLRWYPALHFAIPHRVVQDDVYKGMFIPKGAVIFPNARGMSLDENIYKNPHEFRPERFAPKSQGGNEEPYFTAGWGYGRRICPGRFLADVSLWLSMATILATLDLSKAKDKDGKEIDFVPKRRVVFAQQFAPFPMEVKPRNDKTAKLIEQATVGLGM